MTIVLRFLALLLLVLPRCALASDVVIGQSEKVFTLCKHNPDVRGVAYDEDSPQAPRLFVLDGSGQVCVYRPGQSRLRFDSCHDLSVARKGRKPENPRGLSFALEDGRDVLYFLNRTNARRPVSQLVRFQLDDGGSTVVDLSSHPCQIERREVFGVARDGEELLVSFDASGISDSSGAQDRDLRVRRGILRFKWNSAGEGQPELIGHLPDCGESPARGLAVMELGGARYLWATAGSNHVYAADAPTGRGLFLFGRPRSSEEKQPLWGLAYGGGALWVPEGVDGPDRLHRVNVTQNLDAPFEGPRILRHLVMTIDTKPERGASDPGRAYHYYSRPYNQVQLGRQGIWPKTEQVVDLSKVKSATIRTFAHDPAGDITCRQHMWVVEYDPAPARAYKSRYEINLWISEYRKFVYPHRVDARTVGLAGTGWLADDPDLFNLSDRQTYVEFFERVEAHIQGKYGVEPNMKNAYWAARNALEYIQDTYYYPERSVGRPAAVDYDRNHFDANPGNLKIGLSSRPYDGTQIIACSGTSVMMSGAMRHLGFPARWLGTGAQQGPKDWDGNGNGLLDPEETAPCTNGHRYNQIWLGSRYGWVCFDATPTKPAGNDYNDPPRQKSQWRYMERAAGGHRNASRIVFNVGSELFRPLYRDFEYDERLAKDNNCGGDQRYNLQGRFDRPELWKLAGHRIQVKNSCFITDVVLTGPPRRTRVTWKLEGHWKRDPRARVSVFLERLRGQNGKAKSVCRLAAEVPAKARSCVVDLSAHKGEGFRIVVRKDGDHQTGGMSEPFDL